MNGIRTALILSLLALLVVGGKVYAGDTGYSQYVPTETPKPIWQLAMEDWDTLA